MGSGLLRRPRLLAGTLGVLALAIALWFGIPWIRFALSTVSTDDAFVNGHATFVAPRVHGQVSRVLVDDNNRVKKGDLLVQLDKEPFQDAVAVKKAAVDTAQADLEAAKAMARGIEAQAMSRRWNLQHAMEEVENQISLLRARVAGARNEQGVAQACGARVRAGQAVDHVGDDHPAGVRPTAGRFDDRSRTGHPVTRRCVPNPGLFGVAGATREGWGSRRSAAGSRSDLLFGPAGTGRPHSECG